ncbi:MAG TPA: hypothetical protein VJX67_14735 [Blastocatellia bacterium]|nr:hypothetical protein [Blastocatellia bacterium]
MASGQVSLDPSQGLKPHGYVGLAILIFAEVLLFSGQRTVGVWFTPIAWTAYILFVDALLYKFSGASLLVTDRTELVLIAVISVACWWLFEFYNSPRFWNSDLDMWWHYHNLIPNPFLRRVGYDWAFATIFPALFETAALIESTIFRRRFKGRPCKTSRRTLYTSVVVGAAAAALPILVVSPWLVPLVWLSFVFLLDPINEIRGWPSILGDARSGSYRKLASLLASGLLCGVLWEFWNYWATAKWTYTIPYPVIVKVFEMPILGFLGFPPFAVECWAMYIFCRSLLGPNAGSSAEPGFWFHAPRPGTSQV